MKIKDLLSEKKSGITQSWFDLIVETYPRETALLMKDQKNGLANPVGDIIRQGVHDLFDEIVKGPDPERVRTCLDIIIRIRAVQDFSPSEAVGFLFLLKKVMREELDADIRMHNLYHELLVMESRIDDLIGISFNIFMQCRETIYELKANEIQNWTRRLLKRANMVKEVPAE